MSPLEEESEIDVFESYKKQNPFPLVSDSSLFPVQIQNSAIVDFAGNNSQTYDNFQYYLLFMSLFLVFLFG